MSVLREHAPGVANPNWPLCLEAEARQRGMTADEISDGEVPWMPLFDHVDGYCFAYDTAACPCGERRPCSDCDEWRHA